MLTDCPAGPRLALALLALPCLASAQGEFGVDPVYGAGDPLPLAGSFLDVNALEIDDDGALTAIVFDDEAEFPAKWVIVRDNQELLRGGAPLAHPPATTIEAILSVDANGSGRFATHVRIDGTFGSPSGTYVDFGAGLVPVAVEDDPIPGLPGGGVWADVTSAVALNDASEALAVGRYEDPAGETVWAILKHQLDGAGSIVTTEVVSMSGQSLAGGGAEVSLVGTIQRSLALNDVGRVMHTGLASGSLFDGAFIALDGELLAYQGGPSPLPGRPWKSLLSQSVDLNNFGRYLHTGTIEGDLDTGELIVLDGDALVQTGDPVPVAGLEAASFSRLTEARPRLNDLGEVLWFGRWKGPGLSGAGMFLDDRLLIEAGVTEVDGQTIESFDTNGSFIADFSDDGLTIATRVVLQNNSYALVQVSREGTVTAVPQCTPNGGALEPAGPALLGGTLDLTVSSSPFPAAQATLFAAPGLLAYSTFDPCGLELPGIGSVSIDLTSPALVSFALPNWAVAPVVGAVALPSDPSLSGLPLFLQALLTDATPGAPQPFRLTNALQAVLGT